MSIASQVAALVNAQNKLMRPISPRQVGSSYVTTIVGDEVRACANVKRVQWYQHEICHVSVLPEYKGMGYGTAILQSALSKARKEKAMIAQATILEGNEASIKLFCNAGFSQTCVGINPRNGRRVFVFQITL